ncbi:MAG: outer membrane beta-barrel protein [Paludibacteraceae bacterium]|nr:outer membrane beta-barrel protein [Paludibacteraceae bacterium]
MQTIKHVVLLVLGIVLTGLSVSAETIKGRVTDTNGAPMPFVTISVLAKDSSLLTGTITDEQGEYSVEIVAPSQEGRDGERPIIQASYIGYHTAFGGPDFILREETEQLGEVEVKAKKPLIERQMDKLVVNVSASPLAAGSNGNDILRRAPSVRIDKDGNITVNGKGVEIWVDGKPSYLSGQQLKAMLDGTDGNTIEKIEIISNPSAKYDASGQGGIINIRLKRNMMRGLNGMLSAGYGGMYFGDVKRWLQMDMVSLNLNYRGEKTYTFGQLTQVFAQNDIDFETYRKTPEFENYSYSGYDMNFQYYMLKVGNDWYIDSVNTFGFILQVPYMTVQQRIIDGRNYAYTVVGNDTTSRSRSHTSAGTQSPQHTANLNYTHTFNEALERELTVNVDYNRYNNQQNNSQKTQYDELVPRSLGLGIKSRQVVDIYSAKLDFQTKFWQTGMIECGVKYGLSSTDNHMTTDSVLNGLLLSQTPQDFRYDEHVAAAYISLGKQFGEHWSVKLGVRGEYTYSLGNWQSADTVTRKSYFNPFPTAYVGYTSKPLGKLQQPVSASISYTRRIKRPNYWMLNPFRTYVDAYSYQEGNTELTPEFNNDVEVNFSWTQYLNVTFNFGHTQDMFSSKSTIMPNGMGSIKWTNFGTCTTHGGNISLTELPIVPKFEPDSESGPTSKSVSGLTAKRSIKGAWLALTVNAGWLHFINKSYEKKADGAPVYENKNHYGYAGGTLSAYLPKDWTMTFDGNWSSPMTTGYNTSGSTYFLSFGVRKMYMQKGLIFNLNVQDLARSMSFLNEDKGMAEGYSSWYKNTIRQQRVTLSLTWMFGQYQQHKNRKVGDMDELNRLGGGGVQTGK